MREHRSTRPGGRTLLSQGGLEPGKRSLTDQLQQRRAEPEARTEDTAGMHAAAAEGVAGGGTALPHQDAIQRSFGAYDVSGVQAHVGGAAADAAGAIGAEAYATGSHVAFRSAPDLHTAAHEAAHVVQQQAGVQLAGGIGQVGDAYEQHADAVADAVVAGRSAEGLLGQLAPSPGAGPGSGAVQRLADEGATSRVRVTAAGLNVRSSPSTSSRRNVVGMFRRGQIAEVIERAGAWLKIRHESGDAYIHGGYVERIAAPEAPTGDAGGPAPAPVATPPAEAGGGGSEAEPSVTAAHEPAQEAAPAVTPEAAPAVTPTAAPEVAPAPAPVATAAPETTPTAAPTPTASLAPEVETPTAAPVKAPAGAGDAVSPDGADTHEATAAEAKRDLLSTTKVAGFVHQNGAYRTVYKIANHQVLVFLPEKLKPGSLDVFLFFHGMGARFGTNDEKWTTRNGNGMLLENAAHNAHVAESIAGAARNLIGIVPLGGNTSAEGDESASWGKTGGALYATVVDEVIKRLSASMKAQFTAGGVSIAGHSAGGRALGFMAEADDRVTEVTLQDAGYGFGGAYTDSFRKTRDWFLKRTGQNKILRVISRNARGAKNAESTRNVLYDPKGFGVKSFNDWIADHPEGAALKVTPVFDGAGNHGVEREDGMMLETEIQVHRQDPTGDVLQGTMFVFGMSSKTSHHDVRNKTMDDVIGAAGQNVGEDFGKK